MVITFCVSGSRGQILLLLLLDLLQQPYLFVILGDLNRTGINPPSYLLILLFLSIGSCHVRNGEHV